MHVMLRQLPPTSETHGNKVRVELSVIDTGKVSRIWLLDWIPILPSTECPMTQGISQQFLKVKSALQDFSGIVLNS